MISFFLWYLLVSALGWLTFPLAFRLLPALADRGFIFARTTGLLIWGYAFWLLASLGFAQNDSGGMLLALAFLIGLAIWSFKTHKDEILSFLKSESAMLLTTEILFLVAFGLMAFIRSANSELSTTEKPMELAFISGIMRSPTFPPQDPWLAGYAISYYYFGYVITAMLATLTNIPASMAHNLMTALIFSLAAVGAYGVVYTLLVKTRTQEASEHEDGARSSSSVGLALLAPLFLLLVSNFGALLEVLYHRGFLWLKDPVTGNFVSSKFWTWLDVKELSSPPVEVVPGGLWERLGFWLTTQKESGDQFWFFGGINQWFTEQFMSDRYLWWWRSSRLLQDYDMRFDPLEVIDEFPFFSFLLGDLHPHVLAIPFTLLAIAVALNLFLGGWKGLIDLFGMRLNLKPEGFIFSALVLGGLAFLNTWDILIGATLIVAAYVFTQVKKDGWNWHRLEDAFMLGLPLVIVSILIYLPFYLGFSSQAGGILPSLMYPTRGAHLWLMWGTLLIPIYSLLLYGISGRGYIFASDTESKFSGLKKIIPDWKTGFWLGLGFALLLFVVMWLIGLLAYYFEPDEVAHLLERQGMDALTLFRATSLRRLSYIGGLITMLAVLIPTLAFLFSSSSRGITNDDETELDASPSRPSSPIIFVMLLITLGSILIIAPDFVYLRDQFGYRINTIFKFYYQAWVVWSLAASFGIAYLFQNIKTTALNITFRVAIALVIFVGLLYPALSLPTKTNNFKPNGGFTLDDFDRIKRENPDEAAAIEWLRTAPDGVVLEAVGDGYSQFARVSMLTGLQTVLGWTGHEAQWRGSYEPQGTRRDEVMLIYTTPDWDTARVMLENYDVRYVYIGSLERSYAPVNEDKFILHLKLVFQQGNVSIYEVP
jgi:YYY domain-containing protein